MILYDASNIKVGSEQVIEVRAGTELVWPLSFSDLWTFDAPIGGEEIQLLPTFSGSVQINWGDGDTDVLTNNVSINHTYGLIEWTQLGSDIDGEATDDRSGYSVSMNSAGNRVAIGAINNDGNGTNSGHTRIYEYSNGTWSQLGQDIDGEATSDASGYRVSMNSTGDRVAIGAIYNDDNGIIAGHVRIYEYSNGTWSQLGQDIDGELTGDQSGRDVSMNDAGDRVAIGAILNDGNGPSSGHTRIYEYDVNAQAWVQLGSDIDGEADSDQSGYSVSMNDAGNRVAIGAVLNDANGINSGHTRIYEWRQYTSNDVGSYHHTSRVQDNTQTKPLIITENFTTAPVVDQYYWTQLGSDIDGEATDDWSGYSVSMNSAGDRVAIGAPYNDGSGSNSGHVRIYEYNGTNWTQLGEDIGGEVSSDFSGYSVSMNSTGDRVAIGAINNAGNGTIAGHVRIYEYNGTNWTQLGDDIDGELTGDNSGYSVSINATGDRVAIGATGNDGVNGTNSGHTRIYELNSN